MMVRYGQRGYGSRHVPLKGVAAVTVDLVAAIFFDVWIRAFTGLSVRQTCYLGTGDTYLHFRTIASVIASSTVCLTESLFSFANSSHVCGICDFCWHNRQLVSSPVIN